VRTHQVSDEVYLRLIINRKIKIRVRPVYLDVATLTDRELILFDCSVTGDIEIYNAVSLKSHQA